MLIMIENSCKSEWKAQANSDINILSDYYTLASPLEKRLI